MAKPGRKRDRAQVNRRQKHEIAYRAEKYKVSRLTVVLLDMLSSASNQNEGSLLGIARQTLRRANREARSK